MLAPDRARGDVLGRPRWSSGRIVRLDHACVGKPGVSSAADEVAGRRDTWRGTMPTHLTHWGAFEAESDGKSLRSVKPWSGDPDPRDLIHNVASAQHHPTRVLRPAVRRGWLENGPGGGSGRGDEPFVEVSWDRALDLVSAELRRVYSEFGPSAVYGGSYGWASAGRFHHAQSQIHRFL